MPAKTMERSFPKITEEGLDALRQRIGVKIGQTAEPWCHEATRDNIRHYAHGIGDDNPLWCVPEYAKKTTFGDVVALPADSRLLHVLIKDGWGRGWGFYGTSRASLETIQTHFTSFVRVRTPSGSAMTFRFWDPRVLRAMVPAMPPEEADLFFGPCERIMVEVERAEAGIPAMALELSRSPGKPRQRTIVLA